MYLCQLLMQLAEEKKKMHSAIAILLESVLFCSHVRCDNTARPTLLT